MPQDGVAYQKNVNGCLVLTMVEQRKEAPDVEISATVRCTEHQLFGSADNLHCFFLFCSEASDRGSGRMRGEKGQGLGRANSLGAETKPVWPIVLHSFAHARIQVTRQ